MGILGRWGVKPRPYAKGVACWFTNNFVVLFLYNRRGHMRAAAGGALFGQSVNDRLRSFPTHSWGARHREDSCKRYAKLAVRIAPSSAPLLFDSNDFFATINRSFRRALGRREPPLNVLPFINTLSGMAASNQHVSVKILLNYKFLRKIDNVHTNGRAMR